MNERKKYVLQVQRGEELSLHRCEEICNEESIMRPSYEKAMRALMRIMRRTKQFHEKDGGKTADGDAFTLENRLFGYNGNIIAFAATRGGGKTATMLSFSKILNEGFGRYNAFKDTDNSFLNAMRDKEDVNPDDWLRRCRFISMTPIAPAVLEGEQNILYVVLSRLYRYAERLIKDSGRLGRIQEADKNQIIRSFQKVLSGINGIKHPDKYPGDLAGMQDVCDGMSLSRHFHDLVQQILKLAAKDQGISDRYLVIQLDDADSKMQRVYEVLEDVRKYLMIPNLVILMSVDQKCLSDVVFQENLKCFPDLIDIDQERLSHDLSKITSKYIDKLIPPTHMVQLPQLDQIVIHWGDMLRLRYYVDKDEPGVYQWMMHEGLDLQNAILMLIYRKTHLLFVKPPHYMHNIIPRTLRGFNQLLELMDSMEDVPELTPETFDSVEVYAKAVLKQSEIAAINQRRFADYFKNSWISAKITDLKDREFLRKLADTVSANRIRLTLEHLSKRYNNTEVYRDLWKREYLDWLMWRIEQEYRTENDFRLMFAIRTLFTLDSHQHILKRKREVARDYLDKAERKNIDASLKDDALLKSVEVMGCLLFDLTPSEIWIPKILWLNEAAKKCGKDEKTAGQYGALLTPLLMLGWADYHSAAMAIINKLRIDNQCDDGEIRLVLHKTQELALALYANSDLSYAVRNYLKNHVELPKDGTKIDDVVSALIGAIFKQVNEFNDGCMKAFLTNMGKICVKVDEDDWKNSFVSVLEQINNSKSEEDNELERGVHEKDPNQIENDKKDTANATGNVVDVSVLHNIHPEKQPHYDQNKAINKLDD